MLTSITNALDGSRARVLLQAFGGVGKTALAAEISANWIDEQKQAVLWLRMGASDSEATFEALAHPFGASQLMASTQADGKAKILRDLIKAHNIGLVVLDDCWNGNSLLAVEEGIPRNVPLLVTARQRYPLTPIIQIPDLPPDDALTLLKKLAPTLVRDDDIARDLCAK
ncbi:MAG: NB-ARC domain-containing protein [Chloroflexota bacterium]